MSESVVFNIREIPSWQGLSWSVSWAGRGAVREPQHIKIIWDTAFKTGAFSVGFAVSPGNRCLRVDSIVYETAGDRALEHFVQHELSEVNGVAFAYHEEAAQFVIDMEKIIMWRALKKVHAPSIFG